MKDRLKNNIGLKIVAILFASFLWLFVVNEENPIEKTKVMVPVEITHPEVVTTTGKSYQILEEMKNVSVTIKAKREVLDKIQIKDVRAIADLREMQPAGEGLFLVPVRISVDGYKYEEAYANPQNIQIKTEDNEKKTFPITPKASGTVAQNCSIGELTVEPRSIDVSGPKSSIGRISRVVAKVDVSNVAEDVSLPAELIFYDSADNIIDQTLLEHNLMEQGVSVHVKVLEKKSVELKFDTSEITTELGYMFVGITAEPQTVVVMGTKHELESLQYIEVGSEALRQEKISKKTEVVVDITNYLPEGIVLADEETKNIVVNIAIEQVGRKSLQIPVRSVKVNNLPENMDLSYGPEQEVELQFQGLEEVLAKLTVEKIALSIDLEDYKEEGTYDVQIRLSDLPEGISMIEGATIKITLKKK